MDIKHQPAEFEPLESKVDRVNPANTTMRPGRLKYYVAIGLAVLSSLFAGTRANAATVKPHYEPTPITSKVGASSDPPPKNNLDNQVSKALAEYGIVAAESFYSEPAASAVNSNSFVKHGIEYYIETDNSVYDLGEDVKALYSVANLRDEEWRITGLFPLMDIIVEAKEGVNFNRIWRWSWDKPHHMGPRTFRLGPYESTELNEIWPQLNLENHTQVPPGTYRISGVCYPADSSVSVNITIIPEPATLLLVGIPALALNYSKRKRIN